MPGNAVSLKMNFRILATFTALFWQTSGVTLKYRKDMYQFSGSRLWFWPPRSPKTGARAQMVHVYSSLSAWYFLRAFGSWSCWSFLTDLLLQYWLITYITLIFCSCFFGPFYFYFTYSSRYFLYFLFFYFILFIFLILKKIKKNCAPNHELSWVISYIIFFFFFLNKMGTSKLIFYLLFSFIFLKIKFYFFKKIK